jgi:DNA-binding NtrC family response regulator
MKLLMDYQWPGNVRELENVIERALVIGKGKQIEPEDLPFSRVELPAESMPRSLKKLERLHIENVLRETHWNIRKAAMLLEIDRQTLYNKIRKYNIAQKE